MTLQALLNYPWEYALGLTGTLTEAGAKGPEEQAKLPFLTIK